MPQTAGFPPPPIYSTERFAVLFFFSKCNMDTHKCVFSPNIKVPNQKRIVGDLPLPDNFIFSYSQRFFFLILIYINPVFC